MIKGLFGNESSSSEEKKNHLRIRRTTKETNNNKKCQKPEKTYCRITCKFQIPFVILFDRKYLRRLEKMDTTIRVLWSSCQPIQKIRSFAGRKIDVCECYCSWHNSRLNKSIRSWAQDKSVKDALASYFLPKKSTTYERYIFNTRYQGQRRPSILFELTLKIS